MDNDKPPLRSNKKGSSEREFKEKYDEGYPPIGSLRRLGKY